MSARGGLQIISAGYNFIGRVREVKVLLVNGKRHFTVPYFDPWDAIYVLGEI